MTTKPDLIRTGDHVIVEQGKELKSKAVSITVTVLRYTVYTVGFLVAGAILVIGIRAWKHLLRLVAVRLRRDLDPARS